MTPREQAAYTAGIETARQMALTAAAAAALQGLADGLRTLAQSADTLPPEPPQHRPV